MNFLKKICVLGNPSKMVNCAYFSSLFSKNILYLTKSCWLPWARLRSGLVISRFTILIFRPVLFIANRGQFPIRSLGLSMSVDISGIMVFFSTTGKYLPIKQTLITLWSTMERDAWILHLFLYLFMNFRSQCLLYSRYFIWWLPH